MNFWRLLVAICLFTGLTSPLAFAQSTCESFCRQWQREKDLPLAGYHDCLRRCKDAPQVAQDKRKAFCEHVVTILGISRSLQRSYDSVWEFADELQVSESTRILFYQYVSGSDYALKKIIDRCHRGEL